MSAPTPAPDASKKRERDTAPEAKSTEAKNESKNAPMNYDVFEDEFAKLLQRIEKNDPELITVDWENRGLNANGVNALVAALLKSTVVQVLKIGYNKFGDAASASLAALLTTADNSAPRPPIRELYLPDSNLTGDGIAAICNALLLNNSVVHFDISRNRPEEKGCAALGKLLLARSGNAPTGAPIQVLDLCMSNLSVKTIPGLLAGLGPNRSVHTLILHNNKLGHEGFLAILDALRNNGVVSRLDVAVNGLTDESCKVLAARIRDRLSRPANDRPQGPALSVLELCSNSIGEAGTQALAEVIAEDHTINHLDLINNDVGAEGKKALSAMLSKNVFITFLNFGTIDEDINKLLARNKVHALRLMFLRGKTGNQDCSLKRSFYENALFDRNLLRLIFSFVH